MSVNSQSKPKLKNCYSGVRQDLHHSIQQIALPMQSLPFLFLPKLFNYLYLYNYKAPKLFNYLYLYNYKAINISLFLSVCGGTFWHWASLPYGFSVGVRLRSGRVGIGYFLLSSLSSTLFANLQFFA